MKALLTGLAFLLCSIGAFSARAAKPTVAILYFDYGGKEDGMGLLRKGLAQMLISDLSTLDAIQLVERQRLEEVLAELKLTQSGKIDAASGARVGKLLGARYLVMGGYFDVLGTLRVDARVVEVETGRVVRSFGANGKPDDFLAIEQKLVGDLTGILEKELALAPAKAPRRPRVAPPAKLTARVAMLYSRGLAEMDRGEKDQARNTLATVVKEQGDFKLAAVDLDKLMQ